MNQPHVYIHSLFLGFLSHLGYYRALSRVACAIQSVLHSFIFNLCVCVVCVYLIYDITFSTPLLSTFVSL